MAVLRLRFNGSKILTLDALAGIVSSNVPWISISAMGVLGGSQKPSSADPATGAIDASRFEKS